MKSIIIKVLGWLGLALLGFIAILLACWWFIPDEPLNPEVEKFISLAPAPPAADNAYFMIWGFPASLELDPHQVGQQIVTAHDRLLAAEKSLDKFKVDAFYGTKPFLLPKDTKRLCEAEKEDCFAVYQSKRAAIEAESETLKPYLARYRKIREYKDFELALSQIDFRTPLPSWQVIMRMSDLVDASIVARVDSPATQRAALEELAAEITSWRRMLQSNDWLLTQILAATTVSKKYRLLSAIMSKYPEVVANSPDVVRLMTAPLSHEQYNIARPMRTEWIQSVNATRLMGEKAFYMRDSFFEGMPGPPVQVAFSLGGYRANASVNRLFSAMKLTADLLVLSPHEMQERKAQWEINVQKVVELDMGALFFNPAGRISVAHALPSPINYALRIHELLALSRLLELQRQIIEKSVALSEVPTFIAKAGPGLMDPFNDQPMLWDVKTKRLSCPQRTNAGTKYYSHITLEHFK